MSFRRKDTPSAAAAKASFSTASAYRIESDPQPPSQKQTPRTGRRSESRYATQKGIPVAAATLTNVQSPSGGVHAGLTSFRRDS